MFKLDSITKKKNEKKKKLSSRTEKQHITGITHITHREGEKNVFAGFCEEETGGVFYITFIVGIFELYVCILYIYTLYELNGKLSIMDFWQKKMIFLCCTRIND